MTTRSTWLLVAMTTCLLTAIVFTDIAFSAAPVFVDAEVVELESAYFTYTPTPFKVKLARKPGMPVEVKTEPGISVIGYLARPDGEEPRGTIVLLHTCTGISKFEEICSDKLVSWGYVVFSVDSFTRFTPINISIRRELYETYNIQASRNRQA